ncbi:MAG TPA: hypothetical protein PLW65_17265 [Pseudomonadota bacterium]|nr:hypothetical protein [Pseudomonadota bacterium]
MNPKDRRSKPTAAVDRPRPESAADAGSGPAAGQRTGRRAEPASDLVPDLVPDLAPDLTSGQLVLTPAEGKIAELRMAAADYVQRAIGCELDDSEESLAFVDHYLDSIRHEGELRDEVVQLVAVAMGVYLGEVTRTKFGGRWVALPPAPVAVAVSQPDKAAHPDPIGETPILDSIDDPVGWRLQLAAVPLLMDPIGMAQRALKHPSPDAAREVDSDATPGALGDPPADGEDPVGFATTPELTPPLRAALGRLPPVSYDYYYSLTGRFETLSYVVELIAELQEAQRRAQAAGSGTEAGDETDADDTDAAAAAPKLSQ